MCTEIIIQMEQQYNTSPEALEQMRQFEGCRLTAYDDHGTPSIGYGHTRGVRMGDRISQWYAEYLFQQDVAECEATVNALRVCRTQGQFDALVDFVFNLGAKKLEHSTLLLYIRMGCEDSKIQSEFLRWCYSGKRKLRGLERRCQWRAQRWVS